MKRIFLIRHCKAAGQEPSAELTEEGASQAEALSDFFLQMPIDYIVSSPYARAVATIRPLSERLGLEIHTDDRLRERVLSAESRSDWMERLRETFDDQDLKLPGGESSAEAMRRGVTMIHDVLSRKEKNIVVVTHGNLMSLLLKYFDPKIGFEDWKKLTNPDIFEVQMDDAMNKCRLNRLWKE